MFSVGSKSLNSRGFWKMAKNKKKLRKAIRLPSHFVHHDLMPRKGQRLQQQQLKSSFIIHPRSSLHPFQFRKSQHKAFAIFSAFRFKLGGVKMFFLSAESKSSQQCGTRSFQKKTNRSAVKSWKTYTDNGVFQSFQKERNLKTSISLGLQTSVFDTSGCRKRSGCFCWGDEWRAQHVMRCGKIVSKKSPPQGWLSMERHNFWRPHPRVGHSFEA